MPPPRALQDWGVPVFVRDEEMERFQAEHWIHSGGLFPNDKFAHLQVARIGVLWANVQAPIANSGGRLTAGMAEIFEPRPAKRWIMDRQSAYMHHLFGFDIPDFIITYDAQYFAAETVSLATKLAVITHELLHCGQAEDGFGAPKFAKSGDRRGEPIWCIKAHDVEQFDLPVEWFGPAAAGVESMVRAAMQPPAMQERLREYGVELGQMEGFRCGTCSRKAA